MLRRGNDCSKPIARQVLDEEGDVEGIRAKILPCTGKVRGARGSSKPPCMECHRHRSGKGGQGPLPQAEAAVR